MRVLSVNAGSTSLKLERYDLGGTPRALADPPTPLASVATTTDDAERALAEFVRDPPDVVAHRIVRSPDGSAAVYSLDARARAAIAAVGADAPSHDAVALRAIATVARLAPGLDQFAVSDSAFHRTLSPAARTYAIPSAYARAGLQRIGYHGLSHSYAADRACALVGRDLARTRVVTAHLGGGSSLCAVRDGASIDTTMGYTPLDGLPMATRSGSVDPGLVLHLLRSGMTLDDLTDLLEHRSGLLGISGVSGDVRELVAARELPQARLALDVLAWRIRAALGAMIATLGGVDLIAFTGGIGEHAPSVRAEALAGGLGIGALVADGPNTASEEGRIDGPRSSIPIVIVSAREGWRLARDVVAHLDRSPL